MAEARTPAPARPSRSWARVRRAGLPYLLLLPAVLFELLVHVVPMLTGIYMSFKHLTEFFIRNWSAAPAAGIDNYRFALDFNGAIGRQLLQSFWTTCAFTVLTVGLSWLLGTGAAVLMQDPFRGRGLLRTYFLVPYALPAYTAAITWEFMFQRDTGLVNTLLVHDLHLFPTAPFWLIGGNSFWALLITAVWRTWPFAFLVVTAGLQNIPGDLYEAAALDGAGTWQRIRSITLPQLRSVNQVLVLVLFLWNFNDFNTPYTLFGNVPPPQANLISVQIYDTSFQNWNFGSGSAMSVLLLLFLLVVTAVYLLLTNRRGKADA
ncbi:carbohydrate ABC transporter permease [Streptacidiphilus neutrinimicus]|uniref:carbohydrate ABC transporter permease n=1 Tax=Streptacidiphilus neutrinimicus TaxID=105420 RepID=UPI0005A7F762|nr:sugar ABC transporter permease [Streptacidiphilus neutrinimicus]